MENVLQLIQQYGIVIYFILFAYCALKSGWLPLFAGYAAHAGALDVWLVVLATFAGGFLGDELRFQVAKQYGVAWLEKPTRLGALFRRASSLAKRHGILYMFLYRYPKGMRTIGALPIGLTEMNRLKFSLFNFLSASLWVTILVGGGYTFGASFEAIGADKLTAFSLLMLLFFLFGLWREWQHGPSEVNKKKQKTAEFTHIK